MNHIGMVIKELRSSSHMSRKILAENICTEKYIYLIENGMRTPSTDILRMISDKLSINLFSYYKFLDCTQPVKVCEIIDKLALCQRNGDYLETEKILCTAKRMTDFHRKPWIYILKANQIACKIFNQRKYKECIVEINDELKTIEEEHIDSVYVISLYILLSTCYQILGELDKAKVITIKANDIIESNNNHSGYEHIFISCRINMLTLSFLYGDYDKAIQVGENLVQFQETLNKYARIHYTFSYLAFSYYKKGLYDKAFLYFNKMIFTLMTYYKPNAVHYIMSQDVFHSMIKDNRMNQNLIEMFFERYKNNV